MSTAWSIIRFFNMSQAKNVALSTDNWSASLNSLIQGGKIPLSAQHHFQGKTSYVSVYDRKKISPTPMPGLDI